MVVRVRQEETEVAKLLFTKVSLRDPLSPS